MRFTQSVRTIQRHEYRIEGPDIYGKDVSDAIRIAAEDMRELGLDTSFDDAINVLPGDDLITVWFEVKP